jgi:hypothetical protein
MMRDEARRSPPPRQSGFTSAVILTAALGMNRLTGEQPDGKAWLSAIDAIDVVGQVVRRVRCRGLARATLR